MRGESISNLTHFSRIVPPFLAFLSARSSRPESKSKNSTAAMDLTMHKMGVFPMPSSMLYAAGDVEFDALANCTMNLRTSSLSSSAALAAQ